MADFPTIDPDRRLELLEPPVGRVDVVLDTDVTNEIDDQFAIAWAARRSDRINIVGLHACPYSLSPELFRAGALLTPLDERSLRTTLDRLGVGVDQIPTLSPASGVRRARDELERMADLLGLDPGIIRTGADRYLAAPDVPVVTEATEHLVELARSAVDPLHVVAIGCPTNVVSALLAAPDIVDKIVVNWTAAYPSFWPYRNASFNLAQDLHAVRALFDSGVPLVYLPGYLVGEELRVTRPEITHHLDGGGPVAQYLHDIYDRHPLDGNHHGKSKVIWDIINIGWLLEPAWLDTRIVPTPVLDDDLHWQHPPGRHVMREAVDIDRDAMFRDLFRSVDDRAGSADTGESP